MARRTREAILVCEAAGFDTVLVETVGAGQAETTVAEMVDMFLLVLPPAAGDELQGIKRGIIELADLILVNKADGALLEHANRTAAEYSNAMRLIRPAHAEWQVAVRAVSALTGSGIDAVWDDVARFRAALEASGAWGRRRAEQARAALWQEIGDGLLERFRAAPEVAARLADLLPQRRPGLLRPALAPGPAGFEGGAEAGRIVVPTPRRCRCRSGPRPPAPRPAVRAPAGSGASRWNIRRRCGWRVRAARRPPCSPGAGRPAR